VRDLVARGVGFKSLQENIDTTTSGGKLIFHIFASLSEFERDIIRERVKAGLAQARAKGVRLGRPTVQIDRAELALLQGQGLSFPEIARRLRCSRSTVKRRLREAGHAAP